MPTRERQRTENDTLALLNNIGRFDVVPSTSLVWCFQWAKSVFSMSFVVVFPMGSVLTFPMGSAVMLPMVSVLMFPMGSVLMFPMSSV